jgi:hypothetical protein
MTDADALAAVTHELRRLNRNLELMFGIPEIAPDSALAHEVQEVILELHDALKGIAVWCASDASGQTYLCVRRGFMQPITSFPVDDLESARAFLSGVARSAGAHR